MVGVATFGTTGATVHPDAAEVVPTAEGVAGVAVAVPNTGGATDDTGVEGGTEGAAFSLNEGLVTVLGAVGAVISLEGTLPSKVTLFLEYES